MTGVVDCNNFFVSCERVFHPALRGKPVIVLSNNDGCVIARSNESKDMGIKMGMPFYQIKRLVENGELHVFSSNFALYGDMSRRVMSVVRGMVEHIEVYSIDEAFLDLSGISDFTAFGLALSEKVERWTGIPVSVGIAATKTLAKMGSRYAKKYKGYRGCCVIDTPGKRKKALDLFPVKDVWGIGRQYVKQLNYYGIKTAADFLKWNRQRVAREFGQPGVRTWLELQGIPCCDLEMSAGKKSITRSRSFHEAIADYEQLRAAIADFAAICAAKLRAQKGYAAEISVFIHTNYFRADLPQYSNSARITFDVPTADARELIKAAAAALKKIYRPGFSYKQAGVTMSGIVNGAVQTALFDPVNRVRQEMLLKSLDSIRNKMGDSAVRIASQGNSFEISNRQFASHRYTTDLNDIIQVKLS